MWFTQNVTKAYRAFTTLLIDLEYFYAMALPAPLKTPKSQRVLPAQSPACFSKPA